MLILIRCWSWQCFIIASFTSAGAELSQGEVVQKKENKNWCIRRRRGLIFEKPESKSTLIVLFLVLSNFPIVDYMCQVMDPATAEAFRNCLHLQKFACGFRLEGHFIGKLTFARLLL